MHPVQTHQIADDRQRQARDAASRYRLARSATPHTESTARASLRRGSLRVRRSIRPAVVAG